MTTRMYIDPPPVPLAAPAVPAEVVLGTPPELWLGVPGESAGERAARLDAARDILADDPGLPDRLARTADAARAAGAAERGAAA